MPSGGSGMVSVTVVYVRHRNLVPLPGSNGASIEWERALLE